MPTSATIFIIRQNIRLVKDFNVDIWRIKK